MKELLQQALDALLPHSSSHGNSWRAVEDAAIDALKQAIAQEQPKLKHKMPARGCYTCKHEDERIGLPPCLTCSGKKWEPKP